MQCLRIAPVAQTSDPGGNKKPIRYYYCPSHRRSIHCEAGGQFADARPIEAQLLDLINRLTLPDDWRERLQELTEHREERGKTEGKRQYLTGKIRRLRDLYLEGDFDKAEYNQRKADLQTQLDALEGTRRARSGAGRRDARKPGR